MALGPLSLADVPVPSTAPDVEGVPVEPASVLTVPIGGILRIALLPPSATNRLPLLSRARPPGPRNRASGRATALELFVRTRTPETVLTTSPRPVGTIFRIALSPESATYTAPPGSAARPRGVVNEAPDPVPFVKPAL